VLAGSINTTRNQPRCFQHALEVTVVISAVCISSYQAAAVITIYIPRHRIHVRTGSKIRFLTEMELSKLSAFTTGKQVIDMRVEVSFF